MNALRKYWPHLTVVFIGFYIFTAPESAASSAQAIFEGLVSAGEALSTFIQEVSA